jgi:hypothetical protein
VRQQLVSGQQFVVVVFGEFPRELPELVLELVEVRDRLRFVDRRQGQELVLGIPWHLDIISNLSEERGDARAHAGDRRDAANFLDVNTGSTIGIDGHGSLLRDQVSERRSVHCVWKTSHGTGVNSMS